MSEAKVGMAGFAPEVLLSNEEQEALSTKARRLVRDNNRRWRLSETVKKLQAKIEAKHHNTPAYKLRIAEILQELGLTEQPAPQEGKQEGGG